MEKSGSPAAGPDRFNSGGEALSCGFPNTRRWLGKNLLVQVTALVFFALLGVGLYQQALRPNFPLHHLAHLPLEEEVVLSGCVYRPGRVTPEWSRLYVAVEAWKTPEGWRPITGKLLVSAPRLNAPSVGTQVVIRGQLRQPQVLQNPGTWNRPRQLAAEGIFRQMHLSEAAQLVVQPSRQAVSRLERLRVGVRSLLQDLAPTTRAMYLAMLLGDQGEVTQEMRRQFSRTSTSHLLAISGLHLGALAGITFLGVFWLLRCFPWLLLRVNVIKIATVAAAVPVVVYAQFAGGSPATHRAEVMILAYLLLVLLGRPREVWSALALAALVLLILSPLLLFSISFQLSFAAVAGLLFFLPRWFDTDAKDSDSVSRSGWRTRWKRRFLEALAVTVVASLITAPLVAHYFQVVSLFGFLVNLVVIPLVLMLALPLGGLAVLAQALSITPLAKIFLQIGQIPLNLGYTIIAWVSGVPGSGLTVPSPSWLQVGLLYAMIILVFTLISQLVRVGSFRKNHPDRNMEKKWGWPRFYWTCVGAGLVGAALMTSVALTPFRSAPATEITILDSYAGLDGVVVAPAGQRLVVTAAWRDWPGREGGGGRGALPSYLHWRQWRRLDAVLALQLNSRNAQEMLSLAEDFEIGGFWWEGRRPQGKMIDLMNRLGDAGQPGLSLTRIRPPLTPPTRLGSLSLEYSAWGDGRGLALKINCQGRRVLILPPLKTSVLEKLPLEEGPLAVLVAAGDVPPAVVARHKPETLVLYGHWVPEAENAPGSRGPTYLARQGAVTLTLTEKGVVTVDQWGP